MQVERFFHIRDPFGESKGGATVRAVGDTERVGHVFVQRVECSNKDNYCRKTGRELVASKPAVQLPLAQLPDYLNDTRATAMRHGRINKVRSAKGRYDYAIKFFLPKD